VYATSNNVDANGAWPCREKYTSEGCENSEMTKPPRTWIQAQTLNNNTNQTSNGKNCTFEWTNLMASIAVIYNEVSDTHNSMLTFYTGSNYNINDARPDDTDSFRYEFYGWSHDGVSGGPVDKTPKRDGTLFRYALNGVNMCRNQHAFDYRGYNSPQPEAAFKDGDGRSQPFFHTRTRFPKSLYLPIKVKYVNDAGETDINSDPKAEWTKDVSSMEVKLDDIYPHTEEYDDERCDSNEFVIRLYPVYPNWFILNELLSDNKYHPKSPESLTVNDFKKIVFCICPCVYWDQLMAGNDGDKDHPKQFGERMMAFRINSFIVGGLSNSMTGMSSVVEYLNTLSDMCITIRADRPGRAMDPKAEPWGQGLVDPGNRTDAYKHSVAIDYGN
jgi:hypothetical protein